MKNKKGFTLAEIIIAMTIIGIIAAVTIPALLVSANEQSLAAKNKALLARMSQAISQIEDLRVYKSTDSDGNDKSSAYKFVTEGLSKVYRVTKVCDQETFTKACNFPAEINTLDGSVFEISSNKTLTALLNNAAHGGADVLGEMDTTLAAIKSANGESMAIYYNPNCRGSKTNGYYEGNAATAMCVNIIYDLNGANEAPNEVGKDIGFMTIFFPKDPDVVAPTVYSKDTNANTETTLTSYVNAASICKEENKLLVIPSWEDGMSLAINKQLANISDTGSYLVSGSSSATSIFTIKTDTLSSSMVNDWSGISLRCIYNK